MTSPKLSYTIILSAQPDPSYVAGSHRGSILIPAREVAVASLSRAVEHFAVFLKDNDLGPGNLSGAGLVRRDGVPICRVVYEGKVLEVDADGLATGRLYREPGSPRPRYRHLGEIVRVLREDSGLLRRDLAGAVGIATETVRNLETGRHSATAWTWQKLLGHPALSDLLRLADEAGLEPPPTTCVRS